MFHGCHVVPLIHVQLKVLSNEESPNLSAPFVKRYLTRLGPIRITEWVDRHDKNKGIMSTRLVINDSTKIMIPTLNPLSDPTIGCHVNGYGTPLSTTHCQTAQITSATLVTILPHEHHIGTENERPCVPLSQSLKQELIFNHDQTTWQALRLRISLMLSREVLIATSPDALFNYRNTRQRTMSLRKRLCGTTQPVQIVSQSSSIPTFLSIDALLTVHSPYRAAGKTLLVRLIAQDLACVVYRIQYSKLIAKYGIHADTGLESLLHSLVFQAAVEGKRVCIILDNLDSFVPSTTSRNYDSSSPVLNGIASYLKNLNKSIQNFNEVPFPSKNSLYNVAATGGYVVKANLAIIGIVTCPDNGGVEKGASQSILTALGGGRYRLPDLSNQVKERALRAAFQRVAVSLQDEASTSLPQLSASLISARGDFFAKLAKILLRDIQGESATFTELKRALAVLSNENSGKFQVLLSDTNLSSDERGSFASIGGNIEAKEALEEALALDQSKRQILSRFGLSPPTGVLLYGPPGTGKTLLAKGVAKLLKSEGRGQSATIGGAFFSLQASDIVRSEVGNSEKLIVEAFETARANAPSVIFIDEFQALFTERGTGSSQLTSTLLQCMDNVSKWEESKLEAHVKDSGACNNERIVVLGATNTPWMIDSAFLRPGRFDRVVHVGLPSEVERAMILEVCMYRMRIEGDHTVETLCHILAAQTEGFSGADLAALCRAAAVHCLVTMGDGGRVSLEHFQKALTTDIHPSSNEKLVQKIRDWRP